MGDEAPPQANDGNMTDTALSIARPEPVRWLWYTFGGKPGARYLEVLRDNTAHTHWLRQAVRRTVLISPLALVMLVVLPFSWLTGAAIANGLILLIAIDRNLDRIIDRWLRWQDGRQARRRERWKRNMHRDQRLGIW
jgi:Family of unknown function (DUF5313)